MTKPYYADYVNHCLRFYFRYNPSKGFKNDVDKLNYTVTDKVIQRLKSDDRKILETVFTQDNINITENVSYASMLCREEPEKVWSLINFVTGKVAKERRLL